MRLFVAVDIEDNIRKGIGIVIERLREHGLDVKFVDPENIHITLKFLGEVPDNTVKEIENRISETVRGVSLFNMNIEGLGYFGNSNYIRTLWVDVKEGKNELVKLMVSLEKNLGYIREERREPNPHITIGRVKTQRDRDTLLRVVKEMGNVKIGKMSVKEIKLKKSELNREGPVYSDVKVFTLGGDNE